MRGIRQYLSRKTHEELTEELIGIAKQDRELRDDLLQKARFASKALSCSELKKMITRVTPEEYLWEFREVRAYFQGLESILVRIADFADRLEPPVLLRSVEYAIRRLDIVLEFVDDSAGYSGGYDGDPAAVAPKRDQPTRPANIGACILSCRP